MSNKRWAALLAAALMVPTAAGGVATEPSSVAFSGYATGSSLHVNALQLAADGPLLADTAAAFSGASVNSQGQATSIVNEMGLSVQPAKADRESYGRGAGLEAGLGQSLPNDPDSNQIILGGLAEAGATPLEPAEGAPNAVQTAVVTEDVLNQSADPLLYAAVLRGQAQAMWNERSAMAMLGNPLGFGLGFADDVQLLNAGEAGLDGELGGPLVSTDTQAASGERTTSQSVSATYLVNNGDGTCGLVSESRITIAPVRLNLPPDDIAANDITIEVLGEFILRAVATGKPGGGKLSYAPASGGPSVPVLRIIEGAVDEADVVTNIITTEDLFGTEGLVLPAELAPLLSIAIGEDARAIAAPTTNPDPDSQPTVTDTEVSAAADVVRIRVLQPDVPEAGLNALDLRLGHMEAKATVPAGGINCEIPVSKTVSPALATAGDQLTFTISIPSSADVLTPFPCDLSSIRVVDTTSVKSGNPRFRVVSGTGPTGQAGTVDGDVVTFADIGSYTPGQPPLQVQVVIELLTDSGAGELQDIADVTATPTNCKAQANAVGNALGGAGGGGLLGLAGLEGANVLGGGSGGGAGTGVTGQGRLDGPSVIPMPGELPRTGSSGSPLVLAAAAGIALIALSRRLQRRAGTS